MSFFLRSCAFAVVISLGIAGCDRGPEPLPERAPGVPLEYVALGDSYPAGGGPVAGVSYVDHYEQLIEARSGDEVDVTDLSVSGATTADLASLISSAQTQNALRQAHLVTLTIGGNDFLQGAGTCRTLPCFEPLLDGIEDHLDDVAAQVRATAPDAVILMTNYPDPVAGNPAALSVLGYGTFEDARAVSQRSSELVCSVADRHDMICVDVYRAFNGGSGEDSAWDDDLLAEDIIHPSEKGHRLIAQLLCDHACD